MQRGLRLLERARGPRAVAATVTGAYVVWAAWFASRHPLEHLARPGLAWVGRDGDSATIEALREHAVYSNGYDGQFFLFWALDPHAAYDYIDNPVYRLSRILYPLLARVLAFGDPALVPATLLLVSLAAVALGTFALASLLQRRGASPWWAVLFGIYPGTFLAVSFDLSEPLAYALVAVALDLLDRHGADRPALAAILFGLAGAARESTLVFPLVLGACLALGIGEHGRDRARPRAAITLVGMAVLPYVAVNVVLAMLYGTWAGETGPPPSLVPFANFVEAWPDDSVDVTQQFINVALPGLAAIAIAAAALRRASPALALIAANVLVFVAMVPARALADYMSSGRIATGVVVGFLVALPAVRASEMKHLVWIPVSLWLAPWLIIDAVWGGR